MPTRAQPQGETPQEERHMEERHMEEQHMKEIRLLLVDDEEDFRLATAEALQRRGFRVSEAESGERALEVVEQVDPEVVVLDLKMGGIDGIETLRRLRQSHPVLPVIILTGHGSFKDAFAGIQLSIVDFLQKPVEVERLATVVRRRLESVQPKRLKERTVGQLMVPAVSYRRIYDDQSVRELVQLLHDTLFQQVHGRVTEQGHRSVLVFNRREEFLGLVRILDLLDSAVPPFLKYSAYASFFTGMFLAQGKVLGARPVAELITDGSSVEPDTPLMEALNKMIRGRLINLPVLDQGQLVGVLRDKDLFLELAELVGLD